MLEVSVRVWRCHRPAPWVGASCKVFKTLFLNSFVKCGAEKEGEGWPPLAGSPQLLASPAGSAFLPGAAMKVKAGRMLPTTPTAFVFPVTYFRAI